MSSERDGRSKYGSAKVVLLLTAYLVCVGGVAAVLASVFPRYVLWAVAAMFYLFFALPSFVVGWAWNGPRTQQELGWARHLPFYLVLMAAASGLFDAIRKREHDFAFALAYAALILAATYPPFFLARAIARRRASRTS